MSRRSDDTRERALDALLARALSAPRLPEGFRARLQGALARAESGGTDRVRLRQRLELEQRQRLADLQEGFVRLRQRALAALIGAAFAAGAGVALVMPWLVRHYGADASLLLAAVGAAVGLAIAIGFWVVRPGVPMPQYRARITGKDPA